jgi:hypothetical protein
LSDVAVTRIAPATWIEAAGDTVASTSAALVMFARALLPVSATCQTQSHHDRIRIRQIVAVGLHGQRSAARDLTFHLRPHGCGHRR